MKDSSKPREWSILNRINKDCKTIQKGPGKSSLCVGMGDDAALWRPRDGCDAILTCDWFLEGTHFLADRHPPEVVGYKCLARAISDVAAMGGEPRCFLLSLALPNSHTDKWLNRFLHGLRKASHALYCPIAGGDTTRRSEILISITVLGEAARDIAILRSGARPGDALFVTGRLGKAQYGLQLLLGGAKRIRPDDPRLRRHFYPEPRLGVGQWLAKQRLATAMMDLSDGISSDLPKLCEASGVGACINERALPVVKIQQKDQRKRRNAVELALHGGDDYELLFTVANKNVARIRKAIASVPVTRIGEITTDKRVILARQNGEVSRLQIKGWDPFR
jgi:thiamine-monophosphate kinase